MNYDLQAQEICDKEFEEVAREQATPIRIGRVFGVWIVLLALAAWSAA